VVALDVPGHGRCRQGERLNSWGLGVKKSVVGFVDAAFCSSGGKVTGVIGVSWPWVPCIGEELTEDYAEVGGLIEKPSIHRD
jgi:hypothetical protein